MGTYKLVLDVTLEQELAIKQLFIQRGWMFIQRGWMFSSQHEGRSNQKFLQKMPEDIYKNELQKTTNTGGNDQTAIPVQHGEDHVTAHVQENCITEFVKKGKHEAQLQSLSKVAGKKNKSKQCLTIDNQLVQNESRTKNDVKPVIPQTMIASSPNGASEMCINLSESNKDATTQTKLISPSTIPDESSATPFVANMDKNVNKKMLPNAEKSSSQPFVANVSKKVSKKMLTNPEKSSSQPFVANVSKNVSKKMLTNPQKSSAQPFVANMDNNVSKKMLPNQEESSAKPFVANLNKNINRKMLPNPEKSSAKPFVANMNKNINRKMLPNPEESSAKPSVANINKNVSEKLLQNTTDGLPKTFKESSPENLGEFEDTESDTENTIGEENLCITNLQRKRKLLEKTALAQSKLQRKDNNLTVNKDSKSRKIDNGSNQNTDIVKVTGENDSCTNSAVDGKPNPKSAHVLSEVYLQQMKANKKQTVILKRLGKDKVSECRAQQKVNENSTQKYVNEHADPQTFDKRLAKQRLDTNELPSTDGHQDESVVISESITQKHVNEHADPQTFDKRLAKQKFDTNELPSKDEHQDESVVMNKDKHQDGSVVMNKDKHLDGSVVMNKDKHQDGSVVMKNDKHQDVSVVMNDDKHQDGSVVMKNDNHQDVSVVMNNDKHQDESVLMNNDKHQDGSVVRNKDKHQEESVVMNDDKQSEKVKLHVPPHLRLVSDGAPHLRLVSHGVHMKGATRKIILKVKEKKSDEPKVRGTGTHKKKSGQMCKLNKSVSKRPVKRDTDKKVSHDNVVMDKAGKSNSKRSQTKYDVPIPTAKMKSKSKNSRSYSNLTGSKSHRQAVIKMNGFPKKSKTSFQSQRNHNKKTNMKDDHEKSGHAIDKDSDSRINENENFLSRLKAKESNISREKQILELLPKDLASKVKNALMVHRSWTDSKTKHYMTCPYCSMDLQNAIFFIRHIEKHVKKEYICVYCGKECSNRRNLKSHLFRIKTGTLNCELCNFSAENACLLRKHKYDNHREVAERFQCHLCAKILKKKSYLNMHLQIVHDIFNCKKYECEICGKRLVNQKWLEKHMAEHEHGSVMFTCSECGKVFKTNKVLKSHIFFVHAEKKNQCKQCGKSFSTASKLKRHENSHTDKRPYGCVLCEYKTNRKDNLELHIKSHEREERLVVHGVEMRRRKRQQRQNKDEKTVLLKGFNNGHVVKGGNSEEMLNSVSTPLKTQSQVSVTKTVENQTASEDLGPDMALQVLLSREDILQTSKDPALDGPGSSSVPTKPMFELSAALQTLNPEMQGSSLSSAFYGNTNLDQLTDNLDGQSLAKSYPQQSEYDTQANEDNSLLNIHKYAQGFEELLRSASYDINATGPTDEQIQQNFFQQGVNEKISDTASDSVQYGTMPENDWNMYNMLNTDPGLITGDKEGLSSFYQAFYSGYNYNSDGANPNFSSTNQQGQSTYSQYAAVNHDDSTTNQSFTSSSQQLVPANQNFVSASQQHLPVNQSFASSSGQHTLANQNYTSVDLQCQSANHIYASENQQDQSSNQIYASSSNPNPSANQNYGAVSHQDQSANQNYASVNHQDQSTNQNYASVSHQDHSANQNYETVNCHDPKYQNYASTSGYQDQSVNQYYAYDSSYNNYQYTNTSNAHYPGEFGYQSYDSVAANQYPYSSDQTTHTSAIPMNDGMEHADKQSYVEATGTTHTSSAESATANQAYMQGMSAYQAYVDNDSTSQTGSNMEVSNQNYMENVTINNMYSENVAPNHAYGETVPEADDQTCMNDARGDESSYMNLQVRESYLEQMPKDS